MKQSSIEIEDEAACLLLEYSLCFSVSESWEMRLVTKRALRAFDANFLRKIFGVGLEDRYQSEMAC